ncbi:MAG: phosphoesterase RecJ domain-containing protein, partial [Candidatus Berkelbacteria bacterium Licking1014_2]
MNFRKIIDLIEGQDNFILISHTQPDGDGLGSLAAFRYWLERLGKKTTLISTDGVPSAFLFLDIADFVSSEFPQSGQPALIIILDCGDLRRTGLADRLREISAAGWPIINIDHHQKNDLRRLANHNLVDESACSTSEILLALLKEARVKIDGKIATALLTGFYTDTGGFRHTNTTPEVMKMTAELLLCGGRLKTITDNLVNNRKVGAMKLWGRLLDKLVWREDLKIAWTAAAGEDFLPTGGQAELDDRQLAGLVNIINSLVDSRAAILFSQLPDNKIKVSLRTEHPAVDLTELAGWFNGGGHRKASGFIIPGQLVYNKGRW